MWQISLSIVSQKNKSISLHWSRWIWMVFFWDLHGTLNYSRKARVEKQIIFILLSTHDWNVEIVGLYNRDYTFFFFSYDGRKAPEPWPTCCDVPLAYSVYPNLMPSFLPPSFFHSVLSSHLVQFPQWWCLFMSSWMCLEGVCPSLKVLTCRVFIPWWSLFGGGWICSAYMRLSLPEQCVYVWTSITAVFEVKWWAPSVSAVCKFIVLLLQYL